MRKILLALAASVTFAAPASASVVLSDNFDGENGGGTFLNYTAFSNFTVSGVDGASNTNGSVDIVAHGDYGLTCASGSGSCVDLDGSTNQSGTLISALSYAFNTGDIVSIMFDLSGNQRGAGLDDFVAGFLFGGVTSIADYTLGGAYGIANVGAFTTSGIVTSTSISDSTPFQTYSISFKALSGGTVKALVGQNYFGIAPGGGGDNQGPMLDNVSLDITAGAVPEPASWAMLIAGFGLVGSALRRRKPLAKFSIA